jgi:hypothetical protein
MYLCIPGVSVLCAWDGSVAATSAARGNLGGGAGVTRGSAAPFNVIVNSAFEVIVNGASKVIVNGAFEVKVNRISKSIA